ncbi:MAG: hypothetical protein RIM33_04530 [Alphaproteobacteria bacterium]
MIRFLPLITVLAWLPVSASAQSVPAADCGVLGQSNVIAEPWEVNSLGRGDGQVRLYKAWDHDAPEGQGSVLILTSLNTGSDGPPRLCRILLRTGTIHMDRAEGYDDRDSVVFFVPYADRDHLTGAELEEQSFGFRVDLSTGELSEM